MAVNKFIITSKEILFKLENSLLSLIFGRGFPPGLSALPAINGEYSWTNVSKQKRASNVLDFLESPFLFAVPKHRRTIEKRLNRKFGWPQWVWKPLVPKTNLLMCDNCGKDYEAGHLCGHCYKAIKLETEEMKEAIHEELKMSPIEKEVVVLYEGEASGKPEDFWKGKRIVEMKKPRPSWFSPNLMQKSTSSVTPEDKNIKPSDLA